MFTNIDTVAVKVCTAAADTFFVVIFIESKDIDFPNRASLSDQLNLPRSLDPVWNEKELIVWGEGQSLDIPQLE